MLRSMEQGAESVMPDRAVSTEIEDRVVDAAFDLAATHPWRGITMADIAAKAGLDLIALHPALATRDDVLVAFIRRIDRLVLAGDDPASAGEPAADRVFDVVMRRLEALLPYRPGLISILAAERWRPLAAAGRVPALLRSLGWMAESARVGTGLTGGLRRGEIAAVFISVLPAFLADGGDDLGKVMALLDRRVKRLDSLLRRLPRSVFGRASVIDGT